MAIPKLRSVEVDPTNEESRFVLLRYDSEGALHVRFSVRYTEDPPLIPTFVISVNPTPDQLPEPFLSFISPYSQGYRSFPIALKYEHWNATEIFHAVLPEELLEDSPTSFTHTGHIGEWSGVG
jgi:hypothetical protein